MHTNGEETLPPVFRTTQGQRSHQLLIDGSGHSTPRRTSSYSSPYDTIPIHDPVTVNNYQVNHRMTIGHGHLILTARWVTRVGQSRPMRSRRSITTGHSFLKKFCLPASSMHYVTECLLLYHPYHLKTCLVRFFQWKITKLHYAIVLGWLIVRI